MNNTETVKYLRREARALGCTLKQQSLTINGQKSYKYVVRGTDSRLIENMTLGMALDNIESGRFSQLKGETK